MTQNEHVYAICCQMEAAGDVISNRSEKTIHSYVALNLEVASSTSLDFPPNFVMVKPAMAAMA